MEGIEVSSDNISKKDKFNSSVFGGRNEAHVKRNNKTAFYGIVLCGGAVIVAAIYYSIKHFFFT